MEAALVVYREAHVRSANPAAWPAPAAPRADRGMVVSAARLSRALPRALRIALHRPPGGDAADGHGLRPRGDQGGLHRAAGGTAPGGGGAHPRAGRRPVLADPARRWRAP